MDDKLTNEEIVLYALTLVIMIGVSVYFYRVLDSTAKPQKDGYIAWRSEDIMLESDSIPAEDFLQLQWIKAQLQITSKRYELASRINMTQAYIKYISFIVGTFLCLLGTIVIFKGVRDSPIDAGLEAPQRVKLKISTSSPGAFIVFLGAIIICVAIMYKSELEVDDKGISVFPPGLKNDFSGYQTVTNRSEVDVTDLNEVQLRTLQGLTDQQLNDLSGLDGTTLKAKLDSISNLKNSQ